MNPLHFLSTFLRRAPHHPSPPSIELNPGESTPTSSGPHTPRAFSSTPHSGHCLHLAIIWPNGHALCLPPSSTLPRTLHLLLAARQRLRRGSKHVVHVGLLWSKTYGFLLKGIHAPGPPYLGSVCVSPTWPASWCSRPMSFPTLFPLPGCSLPAPPTPHLQG